MSMLQEMLIHFSLHFVQVTQLKLHITAKPFDNMYTLQMMIKKIAAFIALDISAVFDTMNHNVVSWWLSGYNALGCTLVVMRLRPCFGDNSESHFSNLYSLQRGGT